jgi:hypothetical protein
MSHAPGKPGAPTLVLRLSLPAGSDFHAVAADVAVKIAEYLGYSPDDAKNAGQSVDSLASEVVNGRDAHDADVTFEFHRIDDELHIDAKCAGRSSRARHPLPT